MELECGGHKRGWMKIAKLDTIRRDDCPSVWTKITKPVAACIAPNSNVGCYTTNFYTLSVSYSRICGMAVGYQKNYRDAFAGFSVNGYLINGPYVDGISLTAVLENIYVTQSEKTSLIAAKYTYSFYGTYHLF